MTEKEVGEILALHATPYVYSHSLNTKIAKLFKASQG